ncbi:DUF1996 domain-containing protein [Phytohabitans rumicis]|uniref:DUF1996 domain-containing protein n=1 Tax=Phytohabitans rumicis TaxID=1076125 RepID=UPI001FEA8A0F|nr:DUF1996 domain-containing protein [Phytohabitans rumicis]
MLAIELLLVAVIVVIFVPQWSAADPDPRYVDVADMPRAAAEPGVGAYTWSCGRNEEGHRNTANVVVAPGITGPPHHVHDYIGNVSTGVDSTDESLAAAGTTCANGDRSTYYWPVLRTGARAGQATHGTIQVATAITLTVYGNPAGPVVAMPPLLRGTMGDANAATQDSGLARPTWTCTGAPDRRGERYPRCDRGDRVVRVFDFPSCWDGRRTDSPNHRAHLVFPVVGGACPAGTFAVPRLRVTLEYARPDGDRFAIDAFPNQGNSPRTDHAFFVNLMPVPLMAKIVRCLNTGVACG